MEIKESKNTSKIYTEELCNGDVFKHKGEYYMKCLIGFERKIEAVNLTTGDFCVFDWGVKVKLVKGEFVCQ